MALSDTPLTREEQFLNVIAGNNGPLPDTPLTREEQYLAKIATGEGAVPDVPLTRKEMYLAEIAENGGGGGGGDITLTTLNVSSNGTTNAPSGTAYKKVVAAVPNTYAASDEGKVVSNGALVSQTAHATVTQNGTVDTTLNNSVEVAVPQPSGTKQISITQNGTTTENVADYASAEITVSVSGGGTSSLQEASGTLTLDADATYIKVTGIGFTPKAFRIVPVSGTVVQNSTCGAAYVRGTYVVFRTGTNNTTINTITQSAGASDFTVRDDSYEPAYGGYPYICQTGFAVSAQKAEFKFRSGMQFTWYAVG